MTQKLRTTKIFEVICCPHQVSNNVMNTKKFTYLTVVTTDHHRAQPPHWAQPAPAHRHHVNVRNHHGKNSIQQALVYNLPSSRTTKSGIPHWTKHIPQLVLSFSALKTWTRNTRTLLSHSTPRSIRFTISYYIFCAHKSWIHSYNSHTCTGVGSHCSPHTRTHRNLRTWKTYTDTDKACKQKTLGLVPKVHYFTLKKITRCIQE